VFTVEVCAGRLIANNRTSLVFRLRKSAFVTLGKKIAVASCFYRASGIWYSSPESSGLPEDIASKVMTTIQTELPDALYKAALEMAQKEQIPVERLLALALAQALGAWQQGDIIAERAKRGDRDKFLKVLAKAPEVEPAEFDRLPDDLRQQEQLFPRKFAELNFTHPLEPLLQLRMHFRQGVVPRIEEVRQHPPKVKIHEMRLVIQQEAPMPQHLLKWC
jgi:hypothetical protein